MANARLGSEMHAPGPMIGSAVAYDSLIQMKGSEHLSAAKHTTLGDLTKKTCLPRHLEVRYRLRSDGGSRDASAGRHSLGAR